MTNYAMIDDIEEIYSLIGNLLSIRMVMEENSRIPEYGYLDRYITYPDSKNYDNDISLYFREIITSAVLSAAVSTYRNISEVSYIEELTKAGLKEARAIDEITDMVIVNEFNIFETKKTIENLFILATNRMTDILLENNLLDYKYISLGDLPSRCIVIGYTNDDLRILEER
jgi:hypothetical protein